MPSVHSVDQRRVARTAVIMKSRTRCTHYNCFSSATSPAAAAMVGGVLGTGGGYFSSGGMVDAFGFAKAAASSSGAVLENAFTVSVNVEEPGTASLSAEVDICRRAT